MPRTSQPNSLSDDYDFLLGGEMSPYSTFFSQETPRKSFASPMEPIILKEDADARLWTRVKMFFTRTEQPAA